MNTKLFTTLLASAMALSLSARDAAGLKVYINPGHGGHDANDRNVVIEPYAQGDPNGYWESNSNLSKGLALRQMLEAKGYKVEMSRVTNTTADDLDLSTIVKLSNASKSNLFFSIHSNATGTSARRNFPLMLYRGYDNDPVKPNDLVICQILNKHLLDNQATVWTSTATNCRGDWSFYKSWGTSGLGVLRGNNVDGMLSEGSFHDYIPEAYRLMSDEFCWLEAWHFRKAVDEYFGVDGLSTGVVCGRLNDVRVLRNGTFIKYGDDELATINGAKVSLIDEAGNVIDTYTTHSINQNGFYLFKEVNPGHYTVRAEIDTHFPAEGTVDVKADEVAYLNLKLKKQRLTPPEVLSYSPVWKEGDDPVLCNTPVVIDFNWDMDEATTEAAFKIDPPVEGKFTWEDLNYRMVFTPTTPYDINTEYTVTLDKSACHAGGTPMQKSLSFKFLTTSRNFMQILGSFPKDGEEVHYKDAVIEFRFDKLPNCTGINKKLTCTDSKGNVVGFNTRTMTNSKNGAAYGWFRIPFAKALTPGMTYTLTVNGDLADKDGLTIPEPITLQFNAVDAAQENGATNVIDDMTDHTLYTVNNEGTSNCTSASSTSLAEAKALYGTATNFTYAFEGDDQADGEVLFSRSTPAETTIATGSTLGVHINGDLSANKVYLELTGEVSTQYIPVCDMDFLGWRYISVPVSVESDAHLTGIKVVRTPSQASGSGTFGIDNIFMAQDPNSVQEIEVASLTVHPNPASEYLIANADCTIMSIELYNANGAKVANTPGNILNVSEIANGTYFAVITTGAGRTSRTIVIKH